MLDANLIFDGTPPATGIAITATRVSTNVLDFLALRDIGVGDDLELHVQIMAALTGGTSLQIAYQGSQDNITFYDLLLSPVILAAALLVTGKIFRYKVPLDQLNNTNKMPSRYHRLNYIVVGPFTGGSVMAYMTGGGDRQAFVAYPNNYNVAP